MREGYTLARCLPTPPPNRMGWIEAELPVAPRDSPGHNGDRSMQRHDIRAGALLLAAMGFLGFGLAGMAEEIQHLSITQPGGMPGLFVMGPIQQISNRVSVTWFGPAGYYQLFEKPSLTASSWSPVGGLRLTNQA